MNISLAAKAQKDLVVLESPQRERILNTIDHMKSSLKGLDIRKLQGFKNEWRVRVDNWRIRFIRTGDEILITDILQRKDAYR